MPLNSLLLIACSVIPPAWLKLFNAQEVNQLLGGGEMGVLDVTDMAAHAQYSGGYSKDNSTIKLFWKVGCSSRCMHYAHMQHHSPVKYGEIRAEDVTDMGCCDKLDIGKWSRGQREMMKSHSMSTLATFALSSGLLKACRST